MPASTAAESGPLRAGAAQVDITPAAGVHLAGDIGRHRPAKLLAEPLYAKALVFESGGRKLCVLALDVTIITEEYTARIRRAAAEQFGFEPDGIMVHATQTHSAPALGCFMVDPEFPATPKEFEWIRGSEAAYSDFAAERAIEAIGQANEALQPAQLGVGSGIEGRMAFNRRAVMRDGTVTMPGATWPGGPGPTNIRYIEGPIDPELGVMCVRASSLDVLAMVVHYTCHPVHVFPKPIVSPDWPGAVAEELR
jgi:hypothetical protein